MYNLHPGFKIFKDSSRKSTISIEDLLNICHKVWEITTISWLAVSIHSILSQDDGFKTIFERKNKRNWEWDWLFGRYTLKWLWKVVWKFEKYVEDMKNYVDDQSEKENGDWDDDEHNDLDDNGWTSDVDNPEIVENNSFKWNGNEYPQAQNSALLAQGSWLNGAKFYSLDSGLKSWVDDDNSDGNLENQSLDNNKDIDYLMEYNGNVYRVKFDSNWNLKPTAQNLESEVNVFFENNSAEYV